ncbi:MAG: hypothetical protein KF708_19540, partial [Pirellulales bacterium]|nr:hypothetical protein [Pirellulales bacterium]
MGLTKLQMAILEKVRSLGSSGQAVELTDDICVYLIARIVADLDLQKHFPELPKQLPEFFSNQSLENLKIAGLDCTTFFERLVTVRDDADTYFYCLASLHKARLKYERILSTQPIP